MEKREKIILAVVVIAALYGAIDFTLTSQKKKAAHGSAQSAAVASVSPAQLDALLSAGDKKIATLAASLNEPWPDQLFVAALPEFDGEKKIDETREALLNELKAKVSQFYYTGFVSMGGDRIAIINSMDYRAGEQIEGFTITKITKDAVQVSASDASFDIPAAIELPHAPGGKPLTSQ